MKETKTTAKKEKPTKKPSLGNYKITKSDGNVITRTKQTMGKNPEKMIKTYSDRGWKVEEV